MRDLTEGGVEVVEAPIDDEKNKSSTNSSNMSIPLVSTLLRLDEDTEVKIATVGPSLKREYRHSLNATPRDIDDSTSRCKHS